tara:strand:- start:1590 stop:2132 length:543 start_codon:yes stop_codon:yes gene_type:complete
MKILGIDPGLRIIGFGVIIKEKNNLNYINSGVIRIPMDNLPFRLRLIYKSVEDLVENYKPDYAAIEKIFVNLNPQSTLNLGHARGAAICGLVKNGLKVSEYSALQVKKALVGHGMAKKRQIQEMSKKILNLSFTPKTDAADALGVAICHANSSTYMSVLKDTGVDVSKKGARIRNGRLIL